MVERLGFWSKKGFWFYSKALMAAGSLLFALFEHFYHVVMSPIRALKVFWRLFRGDLDRWDVFWFVFMVVFWFFVFKTVYELL
ncbi:MAG: hypothetical protein Q6356_005910 [Candidatus Wukongarchaeota archaeon]|nr:hypothetical protein [Candidatus Wukongarchaeota archaeon]